MSRQFLIFFASELLEKGKVCKFMDLSPVSCSKIVFKNCQEFFRVYIMGNYRKPEGDRIGETLRKTAPIFPIRQAYEVSIGEPEEQR